MEESTMSLRITGDAVRALADLTGKLGQSKATVVERALKELAEKLFWDEARESFERLTADPFALAEYRAEAELWERGTAKDFVGEEW